MAETKHTAGQMELLETLRAIELTVDGLNTKAFKQKPETQAALDRIKKHCRDALKATSPTPL